MNPRDDRVGPDESIGSTLSNWNDDIKGFLVALRERSVDISWNERFVDVDILNMMTGARWRVASHLRGLSTILFVLLQDAWLCSLI